METESGHRISRASLYGDVVDRYRIVLTFCVRFLVSEQNPPSLRSSPFAKGVYQIVVDELASVGLSLPYGS